MIECVACGRLVDEPGLCRECRTRKPPKVSGYGRHVSYQVSSSAMPSRPLGTEVRDRIRRLTAAGLSARQIAVEVGCSSRMVTRVRAELRRRL